MTASYNSLSEVNARLTQLGFEVLTANESTTLLGMVKRHHFTQALDQADKRQDSRSFLSNVLSRAKAASQNTYVPEQAPAPAMSEPAPEPERNPQTPPAAQAHEAQSVNAETSQTGSRVNGDYMSHHVYGGKAALCWQVDQTRAGVSTLRLEAAKAIGERQYDWKNKIAIQLTREELPHVAAVVLGLLPETKGSNHGQGDQAGKGFEIQHQGKNLFVRVFGPNKGACAVPVSAADTFEISGLVMRQLLQDRPWMNGSDVLMLLKATVARMGQGGGR